MWVVQRTIMGCYEGGFGELDYSTYSSGQTIATSPNLT